MMVMMMMISTLIFSSGVDWAQSTNQPTNSLILTLVQSSTEELVTLAGTFHSCSTPLTSGHGSSTFTPFTESDILLDALFPRWPPSAPLTPPGDVVVLCACDNVIEASFPRAKDESAWWWGAWSFELSADDV